MSPHYGKFVAYFRVSTDRQGKSGLGLDAQREAVMAYLNGGRWTLVSEFVEVESGKRDDNRPQLAAAIAACKKQKARLVIAKLDRLSRNLAFIAALMESGVEFVAVDNPHMNKLTIHILAAVAEHEREMISTRTKDALAAAKARGKRLGGWRPTRRDGSPRKPLDGIARAHDAVRQQTAAFDARVAPIATELRANGLSLHAIARELTARHVATRRGGAWTATAVRKLLARAGGP
jgi:DNA invertase Pin-like site-specific DNA recombinase